MAQSGYTPIQIYHTTTASAVPIAGNLSNGELALNINTADGKLYYKDSAGVVQLLASKAGASGSVTSVTQTFTGGLISVSGSPITTSGTLALTVAGTSGGIPYFSSASTWATSAALAANSIVIGGGAGLAPSTTATGTGVLTALGNNVNATGGVVTADGTATLTNKSITPRVSSTTSITSPLSFNSDNFDMYAATAQASNFTISADAGSPVNGRKMIFGFTSDATPRVITFTGGVSKGFKPVGVILTTSGSDFTYTMTASKTTYFGCIYNTANSRWEIVAVSQEA
jgi:hypothetical protein